VNRREIASRQKRSLQSELLKF